MPCVESREQEVLLTSCIAPLLHPIFLGKPAVINPPGAPGGDYDAPKAEGALFADDFQSGLDQWTHSSVSMYSGRFQVGQGADPVFPGDQGLIIPQKARHYAISAPVKGLENMEGKDFALQYEVKLDDGMTCGGAYVKLPTTGFPGMDKFDNSVKYSVMFGPDKCGSTEKVHFIFQSLNPKSNEYVEHHLKNPPALATSFDKHHHLYALYVHKDGSFSVAVDGEVKREGSLMEEFEPPLQPPKEIDDASDKKPDDWVDAKKIEDPNAVKPDDWDEDAPHEIVDTEAIKPEGWLDDEPEKIPDPKATKPGNWDDEEDGAWTAPMIPNPKCAEAPGCGEWKPPMKANPEYKGKWKAPMIDNPAYIGEWKPKKIPNPNYYEVSEPSLLPVVAVGVEVWTMDQGVLFDDVYISTNIDAAKAYAKKSFEPKKAAAAEKDKVEKERAEAESKRIEEEKNKGVRGAAKKMISKIENGIDALEQKLSPVEDVLVQLGVEKVLDKLIDLGVTKPLTVVVAFPTVLILFFIVLLAGGKKPSATAAVEHAKKTDAVTKDDESTATTADKGAETEITEGEVSAPTEEPEKTTTRRRRAAKVE